MKIIVAEDSQILRMVLQGFLEEAGFTVTMTNDGAEALERLTSGREIFDLLVTDLNMPKIDGAELLQKIRLAGITIPAVLQTATSDLDNLKKGFKEIGFAAVISKDRLAEELLPAIQEIFSANTASN